MWWSCLLCNFHRTPKDHYLSIVLILKFILWFIRNIIQCATKSTKWYYIRFISFIIYKKNRRNYFSTLFLKVFLQLQRICIIKKSQNCLWREPKPDPCQIGSWCWALGWHLTQERSSSTLSRGPTKGLFSCSVMLIQKLI